MRPPPNGDFVPAAISPIATMIRSQGSWQKIAARKVADRQAILDQYAEWQLQQAVPDSVTDVSHLPMSRLTDREREIVTQDATSLVESMRARRYTAVEVTKAFCRVAVAAQQVTNCLTEVFFEEAFKRAAELDEYLERTGEVVGPLHGLPVSIKDHVLVKGHDTSTGYVAWAYKTKATKDAVVVSMLRRAGAVLYVKTANPQTLLVSARFACCHTR